MGASLTSASSWIHDLLEGRVGAGRLLGWYRIEFSDFFLPATLSWLVEGGARKLVIRNRERGKELVAAGGKQNGSATRIMPAELRTGTLADVLRRHGMARDATKIVLEIPRDKFFIRHFDIPAAARANLPRLLVTEIERKTPFRLADILFGHTVEQSESHKQKLRVTQWILRRDIVERALTGTGLPIDELDLIQPERGPDEHADAPVIAVRHRPGEANRSRMAVIVLTTLAGVLFVVGLATTVWRQNQFGAELDAKIASASARALQVRQMVDKATGESALLATLRREKESAPTLTDVWEEISRLLPDSSYVTELRLSDAKSDERRVYLMGLSDSAAGLPALFDRSPLLADTALTAAITPDTQEKRERFSLQSKVRSKGVVAQK